MDEPFFIIDCDPGIDDALALLFAFSSDAKIKAVTSVAGNVGVDKTTRNLLSILGLLKLDSPPRIGKGSAFPLCDKLRDARDVHGADGLGNINLAPPDPGFKAEEALDVLADTINGNPGITLVATGPVTNIAILLSEKPKIAPAIGKIVIMGGALTVPGNIGGIAEFNISTDPEAARIVLRSGIPIELVGLDVTQKVILTEDRILPIREKKTVLSKFITDICDYGIRFHKHSGQAEGMYLHDPLAVGLAMNPSLGVIEKLKLDVEIKGESRGRLYEDKAGADVGFYRTVDSEKFLEIFLDKLKALAQREAR